MEKIKTIDDVFNLNLTDISTKQLQEVYNITQKSYGKYYDNYNELSDDQLKYEIARNLYYLSLRDKQEKQKYLNKAYEFNNSISGEFSEINIGNLNFYVRCNLIEEFIEPGEQENLDKAYTIYQQVLNNSKGIIIDRLIRCALYLSKEYEELNSKKNQDKINILNEKLKNLKEEKETPLNDVLKMDITNISTKQLQNVHKITQELNGKYYDNYNKLTDDKLKYEIARNLYLLSPSDEQEKQKYLNKAYEFNNSISGEFSEINIDDLNYFVRRNLIEKFTELGGQENLDKAYTIYQQVLNNSKGININELIKYTNKLLIKYEELNNPKKNRCKIEFLEEVQSINENAINAPVILEDELEEEYTKTRSSTSNTSSTSSSSSLEEESINLSSAEQNFDKVLGGQGQQTDLGSYN